VRIGYPSELQVNDGIGAEVTGALEMSRG
jgi:hypothetical protein